jgi:type VI secretion system protein ImpJ
VHPFELYKTLMTFAGALWAFSSKISIRDFPGYDHLNISHTFEKLSKMIKSVLESDFTTGCIQLPIEQINQSTFICKIKTDKLSGKTKLFLGAYSNIPQKELIVGILQRIKIGSRDRLDILIASAMPGLQLIHIANPPNGLSTKPGYVYFSLDQQSQIWKGIESSGSLAFYIPNNYPEFKIEILALRE